MEFKTLQNKIIKNALKYGKNYHIKIDKEFALLKLYEEVVEILRIGT